MGKVLPRSRKKKNSALNREKKSVDLLDNEANIKEVSADRAVKRGRKSIQMSKKGFL